MMEVVIIKYNGGNTASVNNALINLGTSPIISDDAEIISRADKVIFPGVGQASSALNYLKAKSLHKVIPLLKQPVLGICLGMQLMCGFNEEGQTDGLNIFDVPVKRFPPKGIIPHTGWNNLYHCTGALFTTLREDPDFYFVHSYYAGHCEHTSATCQYLLPFSAALQKDNFYATQFHPEKSGETGRLMLKNFLAL